MLPNGIAGRGRTKLSICDKWVGQVRVPEASMVENSNSVGMSPTERFYVVNWEPLQRTSSRSTEEDHIDSLHPPWEVFLESLENSGDKSLGDQKIQSDAWKSLKNFAGGLQTFIFFARPDNTVLPHGARFFNIRRVVIVIVVFSLLQGIVNCCVQC